MVLLLCGFSGYTVEEEGHKRAGQVQAPLTSGAAFKGGLLFEPKRFSGGCGPYSSKCTDRDGAHITPFCPHHTHFHSHTHGQSHTHMHACTHRHTHTHTYGHTHTGTHRHTHTSQSSGVKGYGMAPVIDTRSTPTGYLTSNIQLMYLMCECGVMHCTEATYYSTDWRLSCSYHIN